MNLTKVKNVIYSTVECSGSALLTLLTDRPGQLEERFSKSTQPQETDQSSSIAKVGLFNSRRLWKEKLYKRAAIEIVLP